MRTKNETTKKIDRLNKKIKRGIAWARANGLQIRRGAWYSPGTVCPIGAYVAMKAGIEVAEKLQKLCESTENSDDKLASKYVGLSADEVSEFVFGVDTGQGRTPFERLGNRIRDKYVG